MEISNGTICSYCKSTNCYFITPKKLFSICRSCREIIDPINNECDYHGFQLDSAYQCVYCMKIKNPLLKHTTIRSIIKHTKHNNIGRRISSFDEDIGLFTENDYNEN